MNRRTIKKAHVAWIVIPVLLLAGLPALAALARSEPLPDVKGLPAWGSKPVLSYFLSTYSLAQALEQEAGLSTAQFLAIQEVASLEADRLHQIFEESLPIIEDPDLSLEEKRRQFAQSGYNEKIEQVVSERPRSG